MPSPFKQFMNDDIVHKIVLFFCIGFLLLNSNAAIAAPNAKFEQQVLEVLRQHPEVIIESVQNYQIQQQQQLEEQRQALLDILNTDPQVLVGQSPVTNSFENRAVLLEFSDFQCPFCAKAHATVKQFLANYPDQVTLIYKHFPLSDIHAEAIAAAESAYAAQQQGKFWDYHDALFEHQDQLGEAFYLKTAQKLGLDVEQFNRDRLLAQSAIAQDIQLAERLGIDGTPSFFFQGQRFSGAVPYEQFEARLKASDSPDS